MRPEMRPGAGSLARLLAAAILLAAGASLRAGPAGAADTSLFVVTDIHYLAEGLRDGGAAFRRLVYEGDGKNPELAREILESLRLTLSKERPELLLVTGDLTLNGEKASHEELASWFGAVEALGVKVFVLPGNHDIQNPWARRYAGDRQYPAESVTPREFAAIYRAQGFDEAISRDPDSLGYVAEPAPGLRLLMLDSCRYGDNGRLGYPEAGGGFGAGSLAWIRSNLEKARAAGARVLVAMHHSAMDHHPLISEGYTIDGAESVLDLLSGQGVGSILTGHVHVQDIAVAPTPRGPFYDIATNALSVYPHSYGKLRYSPRLGSLAYRASSIDVETWARETGSGDERLLGFTAYAERFFRDRSALMVDRMLALGEVPISRARAEDFKELLGTLNARFFAGKASLNARDTARSRAYRELVAKDYGFLSSYARSIIEDPSPVNDRLDISF